MPSLALDSRAFTLRGVVSAVAARWRLGVLSVLGLGVAAPSVLLAYGTARARACVASYEAPRGPELPDCRSEIRWLITPSRIPWTATQARYRAEELGMRAAVAAYDDATVGRPGEAAQKLAAEGLTAAEQVIRAGSQRVSLEELGRAVGAPEAGRSAMLAGDRRVLLDGADRWDHWSVRLRALEAALLEEGLGARTTAMARRFAAWGPHDEDLRVAVAAVLCLGSDGELGMSLLSTVPADRARDRHESWARNWGDARVLLVACAAKARALPPPPPEPSGGGSGDRMDARAALRLRILGETGDAGARVGAALDVIQMLKTGPLGPRGRVRVLAALLASGHPVGEVLAAELAAPHTDDGEPPLLPAPHAITAVDWLDEPRGGVPAPWAAALRGAAATLARMAGSRELAPEQRRALETIADATALDAARELSLSGDPGGAIAVLDRAGDRALRGGAPARSLARSTAWYASGDPVRALAELGESPGSPADDRAVVAAWWIQRAELLASAGRRDEAARAAEQGVLVAEQAGDRALHARALWTRAAFSTGAARPSAFSTGAAWPWAGEVGTPASWLSPEAEGTALGRALEFWEAARRAPPEEQRALRYAAFRAHRGDAPRAPSAYLALGAGLLPPGEGDVEVWLDAFAATWSRRLSMRAYAWSRAEAARFRGDREAAARWDARRRVLVDLATARGNAELSAGLGI